MSICQLYISILGKYQKGHIILLWRTIGNMGHLYARIVDGRFHGVPVTVIEPGEELSGFNIFGLFHNTPARARRLISAGYRDAKRVLERPLSSEARRPAQGRLKSVRRFLLPALAASAFFFAREASAHLGALSYSDVVVRGDAVGYRLKFAAHLIPGLERTSRPTRAQIVCRWDTSTWSLPCPMSLTG